MMSILEYNDANFTYSSAYVTYNGALELPTVSPQQPSDIAITGNQGTLTVLNSTTVGEPSIPIYVANFPKVSLVITTTGAVIVEVSNDGENFVEFDIYSESTIIELVGFSWFKVKNATGTCKVVAGLQSIGRICVEEGKEGLCYGGGFIITVC